MGAIQRFLGTASLFGCALALVLVPERAASQLPQGPESPAVRSRRVGARISCASPTG